MSWSQWGKWRGQDNKLYLYCTPMVVCGLVTIDFTPSDKLSTSTKTILFVVDFHFDHEIDWKNHIGWNWTYMYFFRACWCYQVNELFQKLISFSFFLWLKSCHVLTFGHCLKTRFILVLFSLYTVVFARSSQRHGRTNDNYEVNAKFWYC